MATTFASVFSSSLPLPLPLPLFLSSSNHHNYCYCNPPLFSLSLSFSPLRATLTKNPRKIQTLILAYSNSASSFDEFSSDRTSRSADKKSLLSDLIQEIEPLDVSLIQKDVPPATLDAMKRTISGMLGLLPSDRFQVLIEALWEPLSKLLVSSMMTGYTLQNAEYRLCLERNLDINDRNLETQAPEISNHDLQGMPLESAETNQCSGKNSKFEKITEDPFDNIGIQGLGEMSPEVQKYILHLQSCLSSVKKELHEAKRKSAALQMQQFVGEEKNDLLDYLRSLQPEKTNMAFGLTVALLSAIYQVAELSEPTSPALKETIHSVVHGLLATLSPKMHSQVPHQSQNTSTGTLNIGGEDTAELVENTSLQFQPFISLTRDYLARLLFWCMLLGHYLRGLEYRMELMELLSLTSHGENDTCGEEQVA